MNLTPFLIDELILPLLPDRLPLLTFYLLNPMDRFGILFFLTSSQTTVLNHGSKIAKYSTLLKISTFTIGLFQLWLFLLSLFHRLIFLCFSLTSVYLKF